MAQIEKRLSNIIFSQTENGSIKFISNYSYGDAISSDSIHTYNNSKITLII